MKKIALLLVLIASFCLTAMSDTTASDPIPNAKSNKVSLHDATNAAINFYRETLVNWQIKKGIIADYEKAINLDSIKFEIDSLIYKNKHLYYYFNFKPTGYIAVRSFNNLSPIAECSEKGNLYQRKIYDNLDKDYAKSYVKGFEYVIKNYISKTPDSEAKDEWNYYKVDPKDFILKKNSKNSGSIKNSKFTDPQTTTEWHQRYPYWDDCPYFTSGKTKVGCVAIAMAQMMRKHEWPPIGIGNNSYKWFSGEILRTLSAQFDTLSCNWSIMPDIASINDSDSTKQVSQICYNAGLSVNMNYRPTSSNPPPEHQYYFKNLTEHFNYTCNHQIHYDEIDSTLWYSIIQAEAVSNPIFYNTTDHAFILDDFESNLYHVNLGYEDNSLIWRNKNELKQIGQPYSIVTDIIPDKPDSARTLPFTIDFNRKNSSSLDSGSNRKV